MQWQHAVVWCCQIVGHESTIYHSEEDFKRHLRQEHESSFNESQLSMIVKKAAQPVPDLFGTLAPTLNENERGDERARACPLCPFSVEISEDNQALENLEVAKTSRPTSKKLCDHIAAHMEAIALLSLPERDDLDDADTNERESENTYQSLHQKEMDLPPVTSIVDNENDEVISDPVQPSTELESSEYMSRDDWGYVFEDQRVKSGQVLEPAHDPTLQEFVRRARCAEMFRKWKIDRIPPIVVYDPDGLEIPTLIQGRSASSITDDVPSIIVSREGDSQDPD